MTEEQQLLLQKAREKCLAAIALVQASLDGLEGYNSLKQYTPKEREPYDALSDRFIRATEVSLKFFRSYEMYLYAEQSETTRDLLNRMEKLELVTSVQRWMDMRDIRNRIVHDYLPEQLEKIYDDLMGTFSTELTELKQKLENPND